MKSKLITILNEILIKLNYPKTNVIVELPKLSKHGNFATNIAMQLSGKLNVKPKSG